MRTLVTSSTRGIGFGIARALSICGAIVTVNGREEETVKKAVEKLPTGRAYGVAADLSAEGEAARLVREAAKHMGGLDSLVYVPPPPPRGRIGELEWSDWRLSYRLLVEAPVEAVDEAVPFLEKSSNPSIAFVTSIAAWEPMEDIATSSVLRPGLHNLTVLLARQLAGKGIRVNAVVPGLILTDRLRGIARSRAEALGKSEEEVLREMAESVPLGRLGRPLDIGWVVAFLASPKASYVTGAIIPVTGGLHRSPH
ncbi:MAG: SDR family oxidoreductase [Desulfurococcales archaeon]|nr:SDR family oxidoreductase [Desulfurococcales archaeon]